MSFNSALTGEVQDPPRPLEEGKYKIQKFGEDVFNAPKDFGKVIEYFAENKLEP